MRTKSHARATYLASKKGKTLFKDISGSIFEFYYSVGTVKQRMDLPDHHFHSQMAFDVIFGNVFLECIYHSGTKIHKILKSYLSIYLSR
jgi:hypothetical protein